ncbi:hypothetical protein EVAR_99456_1 [Eumeta japonica]|uniref:Uncharacterized protein n=1 Tax=Eumeta variegata TaxID=151549 RepID=A0A4C2AED8_EUMVA|nr:hypothetical protein EVAR_99456_1 [Eumeta japonica]
MKSHSKLLADNKQARPKSAPRCRRPLRAHLHKLYYRSGISALELFALVQWTVGSSRPLSPTRPLLVRRFRILTEAPKMHSPLYNLGKISPSSQIRGHRLNALNLAGGITDLVNIRRAVGGWRARGERDRSLCRYFAPTRTRATYGLEANTRCPPPLGRWGSVSTVQRHSALEYSLYLKLMRFSSSFGISTVPSDAKRRVDPWGPPARYATGERNVVGVGGAGRAGGRAGGVTRQGAIKQPVDVLRTISLIRC